MLGIESVCIGNMRGQKSGCGMFFFCAHSRSIHETFDLPNLFLIDSRGLSDILVLNHLFINAFTFVSRGHSENLL